MKNKLYLLALLACGIVATILIRAPFFEDSTTFYLELTKKLILKTETNGCAIYVYSERLNLGGKNIKLPAPDKIRLVVRKAIDDFPAFVSERHMLNIPRRRIKQIVIVLASPEYFKPVEARVNYSVGGYTQDTDTLHWHRRIYIKIRYPDIDDASLESTLRHELFHWIAFEYGINQYLPHSQFEGDAHLFEYTK